MSIKNQTSDNSPNPTSSSPSELALDNANEMSFPASDPVSSSNITRIETAPEMAPAADDHQNSNAVNAGEKLDAQASDSILQDIKIAILVTNGFEQAELVEPKQALEAAGATVHVVSDQTKVVQGFQHTEIGDTVDVDRLLSEASPDDYSAVLLPGGVVNGDALRMSPEARAFVQSINDANKPIASICHGGWLLISAGIVKDRTLTSWPSLQDDFINADANWLDEEVVCDKNFVSSRKPDDIPAFNKAFIALLQQPSEPFPEVSELIG